MFLSKAYISKNYLNVLIELWINPGSTFYVIILTDVVIMIFVCLNFDLCQFRLVS